MSLGMLKVCDEIAMEMIEIDKALDAVRCMERHQYALSMCGVLRVILLINYIV